MEYSNSKYHNWSQLFYHFESVEPNATVHQILLTVPYNRLVSRWIITSEINTSGFSIIGILIFLYQQLEPILN